MSKHYAAAGILRDCLGEDVEQPGEFVSRRDAGGLQDAGDHRDEFPVRSDERPVHASSR